MKKELLKNLAVTGLVGIGIGACGLIFANHAEKKAQKELNKIKEETVEDPMENVKTRIDRLEREAMRQEHRNLYFGVCVVLMTIYLFDDMDNKFNKLREKHNGLTDYVGKYFNICFENFAEAEERLNALEVK